MLDKNELQAAIKTICEECWVEKSAPVLLSALPQMLEGRLSDYRSVLGARTLKAFIKETGEAAGYKLVEHPLQRARVGVVPAAEDFEFQQDTSLAPKAPAVRNTREVTLTFLRALAALPESDLEKIVFPASVLVKLLK